MARWSKAAKRAVRSYNAYKRKLKEYGRDYGRSFKPVPYKVFLEKYRERRQEVEAGERRTLGNIASEFIKNEARPEVLYREYEKRLDKRVDYMMKRGLTPDNALHLSYREFVAAYESYKHDLKLEVEKGERKSVSDIVGMMVSDQVYQVSGKQFAETMRAIEEWNASHPDQQIDLGEGANKNSLFYQMKMRTETFEDSGWFDIIQATREDLFKKFTAQGMDPRKIKKEVAREISRTFYGSK